MEESNSSQQQIAVKSGYRKRSLTRLIAIQIFHCYIFMEGEIDLKKAKEDILNNYILSFNDKIMSYKDFINTNFLDEILNLVTDNFEKNREFIYKINDDKEIEGDTELTEYILIFAVNEFENFKDTPKQIIINEYVNIAAAFFDKKKVNFINAIIQKLSNNIN